jgi:pilus assembly protein Flp/PilA
MLKKNREPHHRRDEDGASAVEYGLLVTGIAALVVVVVFAFGGVVKSQFTNTCTSVKNSGVSGAATC